MTEGRVDIPGNAEDNLGLLDALLEGPRDDGYVVDTISMFRFACSGLIIRLEPSRIRHSDPAPDACARHLKREFVCSIPELFCSRRSQGAESTGAAPLIRGKTVNSHKLRDSAAMAILNATEGIRKVLHWPGHATLASTEMHVHADLAEKPETRKATAFPSICQGSFRITGGSLMALQNGKSGQMVNAEWPRS